MRFRLGFAVLLAVLALTPVPAAAKGCSANSDCSGGSTCQTWLDLWIVKFKECRATFCNQDSECRNDTKCLLGQCQPPAPPPSSGSTTPAPGSIPGEGKHCMPADGSKPADWAKDENGKPLGACPAGTSCSPQGFCRKLQT